MTAAEYQVRLNATAPTREVTIETRRGVRYTQASWSDGTIAFRRDGGPWCGAYLIPVDVLADLRRAERG